MSSSAKRFSVYFLTANLLLVATIAALRPVFAAQVTQEAGANSPEVQLPTADPPSLPPPGDFETQPPELAQSTVSVPASSPSGPASSAGPANRMVLDEILNAIQDSRGELDVPPLQYPSLPWKASKGAGQVGELQQLEQRLKSISAVTQSAQALLKEAQQLKSQGDAAAAQALTEHVQTLRSIIVQLAAEQFELRP